MIYFDMHWVYAIIRAEGTNIQKDFTRDLFMRNLCYELLWRQHSDDATSEFMDSWGKLFPVTLE